MLRDVGHLPAAEVDFCKACECLEVPAKALSLLLPTAALPETTRLPDVSRPRPPPDIAWWGRPPLL